MITEAFLSLFAGLVDLIVMALGTADAPSWMTALAGQMTTLAGYAASLGTWIPWSAVAPAVLAVITAAVLSLTVRVVRVLVSLFTGGGGSAA